MASSLGTGAAAGVLAAALFVFLHGALISNIWSMLVPMAISGAICGFSIAWSYRAVADHRSAARWFTLNAAYLGTLLALSAVSVLLFNPEWTFAELNVENPPIGDLFSRVIPLMVGYTLGTALLVWAVFGRVRSALVPILVTEAFLVLLLGHNVAIIGLVSIPSGAWYLVREMLGLVAFLAVAYTLTYAALERTLRVLGQHTTE